MENKETIIISLGGSLVAPDDIDIGFLKKFRQSLQKYISSNSSINSGQGLSTNSGIAPSTSLRARRFFIFVGGGKIARSYQKALLEFGAKDKERDEIGINVSRLNAEVVKQLFAEFSYSKIIIDPTKKINVSKSMFVGAGWKPGRSTDYVSVMSAKINNINTIINLTNIDYVYDKNPKEFPEARPIKEINWQDFRKIVGDKWSPGLSMPFDPEASKIAEKLKLKVAMINGKKLERLENFLNNKPFIGTIIQ